MARLPPRRGLPGLPGSGGADGAVLLERARRAHAVGDIAGAARAYEQVVALEPGNVAALNALGNLAVGRRDYDAALRWHRGALAQAPREAGLLNDLANALVLGDRAEEAVPLLRKALRTAPDLRAALLNLARAYRELDRPADALSVLDRLGRTSRPDDPDLALERAVLLSQTGRGAEAAALFRVVLNARPTNVRALDGLATCRKASPEPADMALAEAALGAPSSGPRTRSVALNALGRMLEEEGLNDEAFDAYRRSNAALATRFDMAAHNAYVAGLRSAFTADRIAARMATGHASRRPVFIVGMPRSGTTLVEQILASHPEVAALGERPWMELGLKAAIAHDVADPAFAGALEAMTAEAQRAAAERYLDASAERAGKARRTLDKMPHNFLLLGWIAILFPEARIIHCRRDPIDVCVSCYTHHLADTHAYTRDLATLGAYWRTYEAVMAHWHRALAPGRILDVGYEDLVAGVEAAARKMVAHLGLAWDARCLAYAANRRVVRTPSQWQVRQPLYSSSIGRWRRFERHLGPLIEALGQGG